MQVHKLEIEVRHRQPWEAMELGSNLLKHFLAPVYIPWLIIWFSAAIITFFLPISTPMKIMLIIWLAPLFERVIIFVLSRAVFGDTPKVKTSLKSFPGQCKVGFISCLTLWRFTTARALMSPIWQLEGSKGSFASKRYKALGSDSSSSALWFGFCFSIVESIAILGLDMTLNTENIFQLAINAAQYNIELPESRYIFFFWCSVAVYGLLRPFYVSSLFTFYLNQRMRVEGWDIELQFRNIAKKIKNSAVIIIAATVFLSFPASSKAETNPQKVLEEVMAHEDFNEEIETYKTNRETKERSSSAFLGYFVIAVCLIAVIILLVSIFSRAPKIRTTQNIKEVKKPIQKIMGMDISVKSLPKNIPEAALKLIDEGNIRAAISLLYRGSLFKASQNFGLDFEESDTEGDCLRKANKKKLLSFYEYFKKLTLEWQQLAYAHSNTNESNARQLCKDWNQAFVQGESS